MRMKKVTVKIPGRPYPVIVGDNLTPVLRRELNKNVRGGRIFVLYDSNFYALYGHDMRRAVGLSRYRAVEFVVPSGEKSKSPRVLEGIYDFLLEKKIGRDDFILAVGGGVTSDLVGYAAATILRGVRWGVVPTTLVGMVDAAIGGKTGINHERGKNLIGAFWQPSFVCCDVRYLMTLPERQVWAGLGEVAKTCGLAGVRETKQLTRFIDKNQLNDTTALAELVYLSAGYKAKIVARDERDSGARMVLNYGHTFAHGIERAVGYGRLLHGETVLIGIVAALALGVKQGYRSTALAGYRDLVVEMLDHLPKRKIDPDKVWQVMGLDKKRSSQGRRYVLLKAPGEPVVIDKIKAAVAREALNEALDLYRQHGGRYA
jgi:3-dehydroquinate synthase